MANVSVVAEEPPSPKTAKKHEHTAEDARKALAGRQYITSYDVMNVVYDKRPEYYYRWTNKRPDRVAQRKAEGYEVVTKSNDSAHGGSWSVDGSWQAGDLILMRLPRHLYIERQTLKQGRFADVHKKIKEEFHADAERAGVESYEDR